MHMTFDTKHSMQKLGHHILCYVSKFQRSEHDNEFVIGKKTSQNLLKRPISKVEILVFSTASSKHLYLFHSICVPVTTKAFLLCTVFVVLHLVTLIA